MGSAEAVFGSEAPASRRLLPRVLGAVRLEPGVWEDIARDPSALGQAGIVVSGAALASSLADAAAGAASRDVVMGVLAMICSWPMIAACAWAAARVLRHPVGFATSLRMSGFAMAPLALDALAALPVPHLQAVVRLLAWALFFAALVAAMRQALRVETMRAVLVGTMTILGLLFVVLTIVAVVSAFPA